MGGCPSLPPDSSVSNGNVFLTRYTGFPEKNATLEKKPSLKGLKSILMHELA